jgi:hypothetical protein
MKSGRRELGGLSVAAPGAHHTRLTEPAIQKMRGGNQQRTDHHDWNFDQWITLETETCYQDETKTTSKNGQGFCLPMTAQIRR